MTIASSREGLELWERFLLPVLRPLSRFFLISPQVQVLAGQPLQATAVSWNPPAAPCDTVTSDAAPATEEQQQEMTQSDHHCVARISDVKVDRNIYIYGKL